MNIINRTTHDVQQGTGPWLRLREGFCTASEAPAALGVSRYVKRYELLRQKHTGVSAEHSPATLGKFAAGHEAEARARPMAESLVGVELFPTTMSAEADGLKLLASLDGQTLEGDVIWETKLWNEELAEAVRQGADALPEHYTVQMDQELLVSGAERCLFTCTDGTPERFVYCWYEANPGRFAALVAGWNQFHADLAAYVLPTVVEPIEIVGSRPDQLPAIRSSVRGELVLESNIKEWEDAALAYIKSVRDHELKTDEDFANADEAAKWCDASKQTLLGVRANLMSATGDVNTAVATLDRIAAELDKTRIAFTNAIKTRKEARKEEMVLTARRAMDEHVAALQAELAPMRLLPVAADFPAAIKGLRSIASMQDALDTTLATAKIAADAQARVIRLNVANFKERAAGFEMLFADLSTLVHRPADDFVVLVDARISVHKAAEAEKARKAAEAEAARIAEAEAKARAEEAARIQREQAAAVELAKAVDTLAALAPAVPAPAIPAPQYKSAPGLQSIPAADVAALQRQMLPAAPATKTDEHPTLKLGQINERLGYTVTADLLARLGFVAHTDRQAKLFRESEFPAICAALAKHTLAVSAGIKEAA